jgi:hypothetical protein
MKNTSTNLTKNTKPFFSIAIPTYEMKGHGEEFLNFSLQILSNQTFKDFEVVVSDHSKDFVIKKLCEKWSDKLNIKYFENTYKFGGSSPNINNAISKSNGEWIKLLWQDDFLYENNSLEILKDHIEKNCCNWIATGCEHSFDGKNMYRPFYPSWTDDIYLGNNRISSPSVITIKNIDSKYYFNENLIWLMDVEYYKRMYDTYGEPSYLNSINVVNRTWSHQLSNTISEEVKNKEVEMLKEIYKS